MGISASMQAFGHGGESKKCSSAMIVQRSLAEEIARQQKLLRLRIPERESEIADQAIERAFIPALERLASRIAASQSCRVSPEVKPSCAPS